jgi:putative chitinase
MAFINILYNLWPSGDKLIPGLRDAMAAQAPVLFPKYEITTTTALAQFMAQISLECGAGLEVEENLSYTAARMTQVWPSRFPTVNSAVPYAHNPRLLANKVYNGRMGNAPASNDGWNYRGRGATQTTGREGYEALGSHMKLDLLGHPELVNDKRYFLECGLADFVICGCLPWAEKDDIINVTKHLNGGLIDLNQREEWLARWKAALSGIQLPLPVPGISATDTQPVVPPAEHQDWLDELI